MKGLQGALWWAAVVFLGLDFYSLSGDGKDTTTVVPSVGLGFIN